MLRCGWAARFAARAAARRTAVRAAFGFRHRRPTIEECQVIVGTWNLENLFRPGADAGPSDEQAYDAKLTELARVIGEIGPDILAVQEVGDPEVLEDLRERLAGNWLAESSELPDGRGIRVGFLSRLVLGGIEQVGEFPDGLEPIQVDDEGTTMAPMRRRAAAQDGTHAHAGRAGRLFA